MADIKQIHVNDATYDFKDEVARNGLDALQQEVEGKQEAITKVTASVDSNVGTPSVTPTWDDGTLDLAFHNVKGEQGIQGPKGAQGDSVLVGQGDLPLAHVLGQDSTKAMSQKGVTDLATTYAPISGKLYISRMINSATGALIDFSNNIEPHTEYRIIEVKNLDPTKSYCASFYMGNNTDYACVAYYDDSMTFIEQQVFAQGSYTKEPLTLPVGASAVRLRVSNNTEDTVWLWEVKTVNELVDDIAAVSESVDAVEREIWVEVKGNKHIKSRINKSTGAIANTENDNYILTISGIDENKNYKADFWQGTNSDYAQVAYYNSYMEYLGCEAIGSTSAAKTYTDYKLTLPTGTRIIRLSGNGSFVSALYEKVSFAKAASYAVETKDLMMGEIPPVDSLSGYVINKSDGELIQSSSASASNYRLNKYNVEGLASCYVSGNTNNVSGNYAPITFYDSEGTFLDYELMGDGESFANKFIIIPESAAYMWLFGSVSRPPKVMQEFAVVGGSAGNSEELITMSPLMEWGAISTATGERDRPNVSYMENKQCIRTSRYIKIKSGVQIKVETSLELTNAIVLCYTSDYSYINYIQLDSYSDFTNVELPVGTTFIKAYCTYTVGFTALPKVYIRGAGLEEVYNVRPSGGYIRVGVMVNVTNPTCCDESTANIQDSEELLPDYGRLALPASYSNTGRPTRLIIYCHGAAVNYSDNSVYFNSTDIWPEYWLSEGYALLDMEGNPFDNTNEHCYMPQALDCYIAGYKWAINNYNLRRDGVFLGGRSMGGGMCVKLMHSPIPVIAACPNVPALHPFWPFLSDMEGRPEFTARHMGFVDMPNDWVVGNPLPTDVWNCIKANIEKIRMNAPLFGMMINVPTAEQLTDDELNTINRNTYLFGLFDTDNSYLKLTCPMEVFAANDSTETYANLLYDLAQRGGGNIVEKRYFESSLGPAPKDRHHYDTQDPQFTMTITNRYGEEIETSVVYIEMLQFWRRFEQE